MTWIEVIKSGRITDYSGTCPKCGKFIKQQSVCPLNLPASPVKPNCPMKAPTGE